MKNFDNSFISNDVKLIAGIDEAGRGPLAGPVVAAAVLFEPGTFIEGINDSKKISESRREELYKKIKKNCLSFGIGIVGQKEIDKLNILQATLKAMKRAASKLKPVPDLILIDGNKTFHGKVPTKSIVKGDSKSFAIAAASILAKVTRDRLMKREAFKYPHYVWHKNKGYGTREHIEAIKKHGLTPMHRHSFLEKIIHDIQHEIPFKGHVKIQSRRK